jgi:ribonuclease Z
MTEAYALDSGYRVLHHGADFVPPEAGVMRAETLRLGSAGEPVLVHDADGLRITAFAVDHDPIAPAVGYRFDWHGRSAVVSGDTAKSASLVAAAHGADLLVHDALAPQIISAIGASAASAGRTRIAKIMRDIPDYHANPVEAAEVANAAGVKLLVLSHLVPPPPNTLAERIFARGVDAARDGDWRLGEDGLLVELPVASADIRTRTLD